MPSNEAQSVHRHPDFSLFEGGLFYRILLRTTGARPSATPSQWRLLTPIAVAWLPLAILTTVKGGFLSGFKVPFLYDFDTQVRFLIALPLFLEGEAFANPWLRHMVNQFCERGLIAPEDQPSFSTIISRSNRLNHSVVIEMALFVLSLTAGYWTWLSQISLRVDTWYAFTTHGMLSFTWAGFWYAFVSLPLVRFVVLRWYFRILVWYIFLFRVSRLKLRLNPIHPDRAGGLEFIAYSVDALLPMLAAQTAFLSGVIANKIWHQAATLPEFKFEIIGFILFLMLTVLLPLLSFVGQMADAKRLVLLDYGMFAARYAGAFRKKWQPAPATRDQELLGSQDIQSLADLASTYTVVREMRLAPFDRRLLLRTVLLTALPFLPLFLTMFPFEVMVQKLVKLLL